MATRAEKARENGKLGGRPKGSKSKKTIEKEKVLAALQQRIMQSVDPLFNAAKSAAIGNQFLYKIITTTQGKKKFKGKPILVTDQWEIEAYINNLDADGNYEGDEDDITYYFISTKDPNPQFFNSLMDRAFGKPKEDVSVTHHLPKPIYGGVSRHNRNAKNIRTKEKN